MDVITKIICMFTVDGFELPKTVSELPVQLIAVCQEILASWDAVIICLKFMGSAIVRIIKIRNIFLSFKDQRFQINLKKIYVSRKWGKQPRK